MTQHSIYDAYVTYAVICTREENVSNVSSYVDMVANGPGTSTSTNASMHNIQRRRFEMNLRPNVSALLDRFLAANV